MRTSPALSAVSEERFGSPRDLSRSPSSPYRHARTWHSESNLGLKRFRNGTQSSYAAADDARRRAARLQNAIARTARRWYAAKREADALVDDLSFVRDESRRREKPFLNRSRYANANPSSVSNESPVLTKRHDHVDGNGDVLPQQYHAGSSSSHQLRFQEPQHADDVDILTPDEDGSASTYRHQEQDEHHSRAGSSSVHQLRLKEMELPEDVDILTNDDESPVNSSVFEEPALVHQVSASELDDIGVETEYEDDENQSQLDHGMVMQTSVAQSQIPSNNNRNLETPGVQNQILSTGNLNFESSVVQSQIPSSGNLNFETSVVQSQIPSNSISANVHSVSPSSVEECAMSDHDGFVNYVQNVAHENLTSSSTVEQESEIESTYETESEDRVSAVREPYESEKSSVRNDDDRSQCSAKLCTNQFTTMCGVGTNIEPLPVSQADMRAQYAAFRDAIGEEIVPLRKADLRMALLMQPRPPTLSRSTAKKQFICHTQPLPTAEHLLVGPPHGELTLWESNSILRWVVCSSVGRRDAAMFHHALTAWSCALEGRVRFRHVEEVNDAHVLVVPGRETRAFFPRRATLHLVTIADEGVEYHELLHHVGHLVGLYHSMRIDAIPPLCSSRRRSAVCEQLGEISMDDVDSLIDAYDTLEDGDRIKGNDLFETVSRTVRRIVVNNE